MAPYIVYYDTWRVCPNCIHTKLVAQFYEDLWTFSQCEDHPIPIQPLEVPNDEETNLVEEFECKCLECEQNMETTRWFKCLIANMISEVVENEDSRSEKEQVDSITKETHGSLSIAFQCGSEDEDINQESHGPSLTMEFQCGYEKF
ncbi:hypothetical protein KC19_12G087600 [Ceratodon purpureus]|uniref:Uncharacterized protein n=1 Tax=Ceratodon purpureus TaxID=3225 RepID=A0A8T0G926_CERPU|nr:hypothetical protein KC19_12G087600 [Ceratodon purpureus]